MIKEYKTPGISLLKNDIDNKISLEPYSWLWPEDVEYVYDFHKSLPFYSPTPLVSLKGLARRLGVKAIYVKDESKRFEEFGLNAFKGMGGIFAVGQVICRKLGIDPQKASYELLTSPEIREKTKDMVFITTTDGNHGRGVAWAAHMYGCRSYVYMPKGSAKSRVEAIKRVGAEECTVTDMNYDDTVKFTRDLAEKNGWNLVQDTAWEGYEEIPRLIVQGYTTIGMEALSQIKEMGGEPLSHVFLQAGVGSFAGGIMGYYSKLLEKRPEFVVVEPSKVACFYESAKAGDGEPHGVESAENTVMAGLNCGQPSIGVWPVIRDLARYYIACDDELTARGMRLYANPVQGDPAIVSGESAAVGLGLVDRIMSDENAGEIRKVLGFDKNSVILLFSTEGATDPDNYKRVVCGK